MLSGTAVLRYVRYPRCCCVLRWLCPCIIAPSLSIVPPPNSRRHHLLFLLPLCPFYTLVATSINPPPPSHGEQGAGVWAQQQVLSIEVTVLQDKLHSHAKQVTAASCRLCYLALPRAIEKKTQFNRLSRELFAEYLSALVLFLPTLVAANEVLLSSNAVREKRLLVYIFCVGIPVPTNVWYSLYISSV